MKRYAVVISSFISDEHIITGEFMRVADKETAFGISRMWNHFTRCNEEIDPTSPRANQWASLFYVDNDGKYRLEV